MVTLKITRLWTDCRLRCPLSVDRVSIKISIKWLTLKAFNIRSRCSSSFAHNYPLTTLTCWWLCLNADPVLFNPCYFKQMFVFIFKSKIDGFTCIRPISCIQSLRYHYYYKKCDFNKKLHTFCKTSEYPSWRLISQVVSSRRKNLTKSLRLSGKRPKW